jgi:phosphoglycerate dehydrogenase-like enzyme
MAERFRVILTDFMDEATVEETILGGMADLITAQSRDEDELAPFAAEADALIAFHDINHIGEATFSRAPRCKGAVRAGVGYNNIDLAAAGRHGVVVCNVPDYGTEEVADHAILLLLAVNRRLLPCATAIRAGTWDHKIAYGTPRLRGKTLGIVGCGRIGSATALRGKAFGLDVVFYDPYLPDGYDKALGIRRARSLGELMEQSHYVSLHCYLSPETRHMIDADALGRMPRGGIVINTARGPVIDQEALVAALTSGHLGGAGLDVCEREPLDDDRLRNHPSVVLTPHSAFYSAEGFIELRRKAAEEVARILRNEPPRNLVNRPQLVARPRTQID